MSAIKSILVLCILILNGSCSQESNNSLTIEDQFNDDKTLIHDGPKKSGWPHLGGLNRNFTSESIVPTKFVYEDVRSMKNLNVGPIHFALRANLSPIISDGCCYVISDEANRIDQTLDYFCKKYMFKFRYKSLPLGEHELTSHELFTGLEENEIDRGMSDVVDSCPATNGKMIFVAVPDKHEMACVAYATKQDEQTKPAWRTVLCFKSNGIKHHNPLTLWKNLVIVVVQERKQAFICALDQGSGKLIWRSLLRKVRNGAGASIVNIGQKELLAVDDYDCLRIIDPFSGRTMNKIPHGEQRTRSIPVQAGNMVFVTGKKKFLAIDLALQEIAWQKNAESFYSSPICLNDNVIVTSMNGTIKCFRQETGEELWELKSRKPVYSTPTLVGENLYVGCEDGTVLVIDISKKSPKILEENKLPGNIYSSFAIADNKMVIVTTTDVFWIASRN